MLLRNALKTFSSDLPNAMNITTLW